MAGGRTSIPEVPSSVLEEVDIYSGPTVVGTIGPELATFSLTVSTPILRTVPNPTGESRHICQGNQITPGTDLHETVVVDTTRAPLDQVVAIMYAVKGNDGGFFRFDCMVGGSLDAGVLTVGTVDSKNVGVDTSTPAHPLDVNGEVGSHGVVFTPKAAAAAALNEQFVDSADGVLKFKDAGGVVHPLY